MNQKMENFCFYGRRRYLPERIDGILRLYSKTYLGKVKKAN